MQDWKKEFQEAFRSSEELSLFLDHEVPTLERYPLFIPQSLATRIKEAGPDSALWKQFVPSQIENQPGGYEDPIGDKLHFKGGQIIHRYHNRALLLPTQVCPVNCRYCFRKNELQQNEDLFVSNEEETLKYLTAHPEIEEIIFSGGDPLILSDEKLYFWLKKLSRIDHIKFIRFHTRTPVILPSRIDLSFMDLIHKFSHVFEKIIMVIHCNHRDELDEHVIKKLKILSHSDLLLLSQTVLLKGINDCPQKLRELFTELSFWGVKPYYLHHPDKVQGALHFQLERPEGLDIYQQLRHILPGWQLPQYVVDSAEGTGKTPIGI